MDTVRALIEALYRDFLLRDLFGKILPGTIVLWSLSTEVPLPSWPEFRLAETNTNIPLIMLLAGLAWILGFAVQSAGEWCQLIRHNPPGHYDCVRPRYALRISFKHHATEAQKLRAERYATIKEASGNAAAAGLSAFLIVVIRFTTDALSRGGWEYFRTGWNSRSLVGAVGAALFVVALARSNRRHAIKHYDFMEATLRFLPGQCQSVLVLDFDGVIADSMNLQEEAWKQALSEVVPDHPPALMAQISKNLYAGKAGSQMFEDLSLDPETIDRLRRRKSEIWSLKQEEVQLLPGVKTHLPRLARDMTIAIATTAARKYVLRVLERERLLCLIDLIVTNADVQVPKPAPEMLFMISRRTLCPPAELCLVGDTSADREMAAAAGSAFILLRPSAQAWSPTTNLDGERVAPDWLELSRMLGEEPRGFSARSSR